MSTLQLSLAQARQLHLHAQGLLTRPVRRATKADVLASIRRMALLQIDSINVVARSPYLVLFSRLGAYQPQWLDQLLAEGSVFEYWAHEACFVPREDYGLLRHRMLDPSAMGWKAAQAWQAQHADAIAALLEQVRAHGPVRAQDFARREGSKGNGWWDWKPEKRHLEALFTSGRLMVRERRQFQRVYDVAERVLPDWDDARDLPTPEAAQLAMLRHSCRALGVVSSHWVGDYYRLPRGRYHDALGTLVDAGELLPARVEGWPQDLFVHHSLAPLLQHGLPPATACSVLSPFDPVVWDRRRASELFGFDYRIECYTPAHKRRYGYFVLPVLCRGRLVARLDAKAHRDRGVFEIKALYLEQDVRPGPRLRADLRRALQQTADWHGTPTLHFARHDEQWLSD